MISVAVETPGMTGIPSSRQRSTTRRLNPGVTTKRAPARCAMSTCSGRMTVPAPTSSSPSAASVRSARDGASVRKVTSATGSPPRLSAAASGAATGRRSSATMTGTTPGAQEPRGRRRSLIARAIRHRRDDRSAHVVGRREARKTVAPARSAAAPATGRDPLEDRAAAIGSLRSAFVLSVAMYPGAIALTLMPCGAHSFASALTRPGDR